MKYLVMENREGHSVVMDENGQFHRVANFGYEIGDTVTEPVFMKTPELKKKTNWKKISTIAAIFVCMLLTAIPLINSNTESDVVVYMSINPEIHLELNKDGKINKLVADNDDGKILLEGYKYKGKSVSDVLIELISKAEKLEYLKKGGDIHITVESGTEDKAKTVEVDLSAALKDSYVKKYLIKIKANEEEFQNLDEVLNRNNALYSSETKVTEENNATKNTAAKNNATYHTDNTLSTEESSTANNIETGTDNQKETIKPTEISKPTVKPTETPTETSSEAPTQSSSEATAATEENGNIDDDIDEDDFYWPWWPIWDKYICE